MFSLFIEVFFFSALLLTNFAHAKSPESKFTFHCERHLREGDEETKLLLHISKTKTCSNLAKKLSKATSFSEFIPPRYQTGRHYMVDARTWMNHFPEFLGIKYNAPVSDYVRSGNLPNHMMASLFSDLRRYSMFKNLTVLDADSIRLDNICSALKALKGQIKTIIAGNYELKKLTACTRYVKEIVLTDFPDTETIDTFKDKIIGISNGSTWGSGVQEYPNLRYLHSDLFLESQNIEQLFIIPKLTHLSIISNFPIKNASALGDLKSLMYLRIACLKDTNNVTWISLDEPCISDLSWIKSLTWLKHLDLSYAGLRDLMTLELPPHIETVDLSHNFLPQTLDMSRFRSNVKFIFNSRKR